MQDKALEWQTDIWDRMSRFYEHEIDVRFASIVDAVLAYATLSPGDRVLDLGTGTGSVALRAAAAVTPGGHVTGVDISADMLAVASRRAADRHLHNVEFLEGQAEAVPVDDRTMDVVLASLSLMFVLDRAAAAREITRVLKRPGGRFVAAVWAGPDDCDIVQFQSIAGKFAAPPAKGAGPGSMADADEFVGQLADAGIDVRVERQEHIFEFTDFDSAWNVLAGVTAAQLAPDVQEAAKQAVRDRMWTDAGSPRRFRNLTQFIIGRT